MLLKDHCKPLRPDELNVCSSEPTSAADLGTVFFSVPADWVGHSDSSQGFAFANLRVVQLFRQENLVPSIQHNR